MGKKAKSLEEQVAKFWINVDKTDTCWLWKSNATNLGYGSAYYKGKTWGAHRLSWILANGDILPDHTGWTRNQIVCHKCNVKLCVNPDHLYLGTNGTNAADIVLSGYHPTKDISKKRYSYELEEGNYVRKHGMLSATAFFELHEQELWEFISRLPRGEFSEGTKLFWKTRMEIQKEENHPENIYMKKMQDAVTRIEIPWLAEMEKESEDK